MDLPERIEAGMQLSLRFATANGCPPLFAKAIRHAVFPGGARIRPKLCLAVATACGDSDPQAADAAATAIELLHCASLVHDDMPCFDNAATRRGQASVHAEFGEEIALLVGDGLIVAAFETVARETMHAPRLTAPLIATIAKAVGSPYGLVAGQAWESEAEINIDQYHRAKTASLFAGAVSTGALASGGSPQDWLPLADALGSAYQVADDLYDVIGEGGSMGKPVGQDARNAKPNIAIRLGIEGALKHLRTMVDSAADSVPDCPGRDAFRAMIRNEATRLMPKKLAASAA
ncbi:polyprenyl synthetase family protein [Ciceribacter sp. L1K22]|uniref:polyprenyl synthetase family protein n=1 Tax=Ciceribacter sp. L1K22 TaxID=2820275 RepID=UPI001ABDB73E|nr:polyprenyl synthetase family protein [Ciceribacter sp. L1K22]MBO3761758.1 polyprenyl synthetase family protein [Ciceribacter sp. L1K22]